MTDDEMAKALAAMVQDIWKQKGMPDKINKAVTKEFAKKLWSGVVEGYGQDLTGIDYDTPDANMLQNLQHSVYAFSAAKNYHQMKALTQALVGDDNKLRTYSQFKQQAFAINDTHVNQWLKTEYNTAICSGQMSSKWVKIQQDKATLTILEFDAIIDGHTTDLCRKLNGMRKPPDNPVWNIYYPPNHFGERSTVRQTTGKETPDSEIEEPEIPAMFRTNLAKSGLVFPKGHAYFKDLPDDILVQASKLIPDAE